MVGWKRGGLGHLLLGFAILVALVAVVQVSLPVSQVAGTVLELAPELMSVPSVLVTVPERPSWEQSVNSLRDFNYVDERFERRELCRCSECRCSGRGCDANGRQVTDLLDIGGDRSICLGDRGSRPFGSNYSL